GGGCWSRLVISRPSNSSAAYSPYVRTLSSPSVARFTAGRIARRKRLDKARENRQQFPHTDRGEKHDHDNASAVPSDVGSWSGGRGAGRLCSVQDGGRRAEVRAPRRRDRGRLGRWQRREVSSPERPVPRGG